MNSDFLPSTLRDRRQWLCNPEMNTICSENIPRKRVSILKLYSQPNF